MTGPRTSYLQMFFNYAFTLFSSVYFLTSAGCYLIQAFNTPAVCIELIASIMCAIFSISCSLTEPGIVSLKTHLVGDFECPLPLDKIITAGHEYYSLA